MVFLLITAASVLSAAADSNPVDVEISALHQLARSTYLADQIGFHPRQVAQELETGIDEIRRRLSMLDKFMGDSDPRIGELRKMRARLGGLAQFKIETRTQGPALAQVYFDALRASVIQFIDLDARDRAWLPTPHGQVFEAIGVDLGHLVVALTDLGGPRRDAVVRVMQTIEDFARFLDERSAAHLLATLREPLAHAADALAPEPRPANPGYPAAHNQIRAAVRAWWAMRAEINARKPSCETIFTLGVRTEVQSRRPN